MFHLRIWFSEKIHWISSCWLGKKLPSKWTSGFIIKLILTHQLHLCSYQINLRSLCKGVRLFVLPFNSDFFILPVRMLSETWTNTWNKSIHPMPLSITYDLPVENLVVTYWCMGQLLSNHFKSMVHPKPCHWDQNHEIVTIQMSLYDFVSPNTLKFKGWTCDFI